MKKLTFLICLSFSFKIISCQQCDQLIDAIENEIVTALYQMQDTYETDLHCEVITEKLDLLFKLRKIYHTNLVEQD